MTITTIAQDALTVLGAIGAICTVLAHLPFPAVWAQRFARAAIWASNVKFSVNVRQP
jgi:hypothetical protein